MSVFRSYANVSMNTKSNLYLKRALNQKINMLGIDTLEQPEMNNKLMRGEQYMESTLTFYKYVIDTLTNIILLGTSIAILVNAFPLLLPLILLASIPKYLSDKHFRLAEWKRIFYATESNRKANVSGSDLTNPNKLQEVFINNSYNFLDLRFYHPRMANILARLKTNKTWMIVDRFLQVISDCVTYIGYYIILSGVIIKKFTIGSGMFYIRSMQDFGSNLESVLTNYNEMSSYALRVKDFYEIMETAPKFKDGGITLGKLTSGPKIEFKNVNFSYPNSAKLIVENLTLTINPGEKVAIVGQNGAGKTTLVKLINRMYQLTSGTILINDTDLIDLKLSDYYKNVGVLFQEFATYPQLSARENIIIGDPEKEPTDYAVAEAAKNADAYDFIMEYPNKFDQILGEKFKGGIRPSTGQWQKIAIARFFYRNAPLVIFDEPTAAIDAISEYNIFNKIYDFFKGKTVIIISHRFSTVRNADRILVMEHGKIVEDGTHDTLMKLDGYYAKSFKLQAEGYSDKNEDKS